MSNVRPMAVAGQFYPDNPSHLQALVEDLLAPHASLHSPHQVAQPKGLIVPHAGLRYSGATAAKAYSLLKPYSDQIRRVVMIGPSHRVGFKGIAYEPAEQVHTPFGLIDVDHSGIDELEARSLVFPMAQAHQHEHCLEVQWPFLQRVLNDVRITPLVAGEANKYEVAEVLASLWGGEETLVVISTDLSHFHPASECEKIDASTCRDIVNKVSELKGEQACGCKGLNGLLYLAKRYGWNVEQLGYSHSGQTGGSQDRVVGYGAFSIEQPGTFDMWNAMEISDQDKSNLLALARASIRKAISNDKSRGLESNDTDGWPAHLFFKRASFVSLHTHGQLRGCIGSLEAHQPLIENIRENSVKAALHDPRFAALQEHELDGLEIEISVLTTPKPMRCDSEQDCIRQLRIGQDGLIIESGRHRATFLPLVWRSLPTPEDFMRHLKQKAGLQVDEWPENMKVWTYQAMCFAES